MTETGNTVLREALALSRGERAQVAADLIASLDEPHDESSTVGPAWAEEAARRARQVLAAPGASESWEDVRGRLADRLRRD